MNQQLQPRLDRQSEAQTPKQLHLSAEDVRSLRKKFEDLASEVTPFSDNIKYFSLIAAYGIYREIGSVNDELARFIFAAEAGKVVRRESLRATLIEWNGLVGVRIWSVDTSRLQLRTKNFFEVVHPKLGRNADGTWSELNVFPEIANEIAASAGIQLVVVKSWGQNSIFGGFDPKKEFYQTNFWELENNDAMKFADLLRSRQLALMGTHDLIAHVAGVSRDHWPRLIELADRVYKAIDIYFKEMQPNIPALVLTYTLGTVLDDLAQPPSYGSRHHIVVIEELMAQINQKEIPAGEPWLLTRFPSGFQKVIELARTHDHFDFSFVEHVRTVVGDLVGEIKNASIRITS